MKHIAHGLLVKTRLGLFQEALGSSTALASAAISTLLYYPAITPWIIVPLSIGFLGVFLASLRGAPSLYMLISLWCYVASSLVLGLVRGLGFSEPLLVYTTAAFMVVAVICISSKAGLAPLALLVAPLALLDHSLISLSMAIAMLIIPLEYIRMGRLKLHQLSYSIGLLVALVGLFYGLSLFPLLAMLAASMLIAVVFQSGYRYCPFRVEEGLSAPALMLGLLSSLLALLSELLGFTLFREWAKLVSVIALYTTVTSLMVPRRVYS